MEFITHQTQDGERWDSLAFLYYGDPLAYERIIVANPYVPVDPVLPAGLELRIPVLEDAEAEPVLGAGVPPWKVGG